MSVFSPINKKEKLKWLDEKSKLETFSELQIQKFLFFAEMFNRIDGLEYDLKKLRAYEKGPVFSDVYGDIRHDKSELFSQLSELNTEFPDKEIKNLKSALFITKAHTDKELSALTHIFDLWKSKEKRIKRNETQIPILEKDITEKDEKLIKEILNSTKDIDDFKVINIDEKIFFLNKEEADLLNEDHNQTLELLSTDEDLINPVYVTFEKGVMLID